MKQFRMAILWLVYLTSPQIDAADIRFNISGSGNELLGQRELLCGQGFLWADERAGQCSVKVIQESPIRMVTSSDQGIFPKRWRSAPTNAQAERLPVSEFARSNYILNKVLEMYPTSFLKRNLGVIYVLNSIEFHGISISGTISGRNVYIAYPGIADILVELTFHHEFSHILFNNFRNYFDRESWEKANPNSFQYGKGGLAFIKQNRPSNLFDATLHEEGFLNEYSRSSLDEDFSSIAAHLFLGSVRFWKIVSQYPRIKEKTDLVVAFYHNIDSEFDESFFKSIAKGSGSGQSAPADSKLKQ